MHGGSSENNKIENGKESVLAYLPSVSLGFKDLSMLHWSKINLNDSLKASAREKHQYLALQLKSLSTALLLVVPGQANPHLLPVAGLDTCHHVTRSLGQSWCAPTAQSSYRWPWPAAEAHTGITWNHIHSRTKGVAKLGLSGKCLTQSLVLCPSLEILVHPTRGYPSTEGPVSSKQQTAKRLLIELERYPSLSGVLRASNSACH